jgi:hypothetical protein
LKVSGGDAKSCASFTGEAAKKLNCLHCYRALRIAKWTNKETRTNGRRYDSRHRQVQIVCMALDVVHVFALLSTWFNSIIQRIIIFALLAGPIPNHVAFIMDGNRRFARRHNEPVAKGHDQGSQALRRVCQLIYCRLLVLTAVLGRRGM